MPTKPKNLIYIFADQWRRSACGYFNDTVITPNIDNFMKNSAVFRRAYSSCPVCSPHRACLMSGMRTLRNGVFTNCKPEFNIGLDKNTECISDVFKKASYRTGYIGKWHLSHPDGSSPYGGWDAFTPTDNRHGFDFWYSYGTSNDHLHPHYWNGDKLVKPGNVCSLSWSPVRDTDIALEFLQKHDTRPFCLFVSYNPPHSPYGMTPEKYTSQYKVLPSRPNMSFDALHHHTGEDASETVPSEAIRGYFGAVTGIDDQFGRIIKYLVENNLYDNTVIVISSDHGDMMCSHGLMGKYVWYEEAVGIPLAIGGGGIDHSETDTLIGSNDQAPTILSFMGLPVPSSMDGCDLSGEINGHSHKHHDSLLISGFSNKAEYHKEFLAENCDPFAFGWRAVVTDDLKYAVFNGYKYGEAKKTYLYSLKNDPYEMHNLAGCAEESPMRSLLKEKLTEANDTFII